MEVVVAPGGGRSWYRCSLASALQQLAGTGRPTTSPELGEITLRPHQIEAVDLLNSAIAGHGGALLADGVGLGKTYTALAVGRSYRNITVVHPAVLAGMWRQALALTRTTARLVSWESLSRRPTPLRPDLLILDEAQHARNPLTARYRHVADLAWGAHVLLLSATPLHNSAADLDALLALFAGTGASRQQELLARVIVRRTQTQERLPAVLHERPLTVPGSMHVLDAILALPPAVHAATGGAALTQLSLIRQWASSDAALDAALRRRRLMTEAAIISIRAGRTPDKATLTALIAGDDALQPDLFHATGPGDPGGDTLRALSEHAEAVSTLQDLVWLHPSDHSRFLLLEETITRHAGARCVLFTHSARTALAVWRALRNRFRIACLSGRGALIASGRLPRREVIAAFAPGAVQPSRAARIDVLVTTDVLSEGVSLHDASVVVNIDLPWTASKVEQRVGRLRRLGSPHHRVTVVTIAPPAPAERLLGVVEGLVRKAGIADRLVGAGDSLALKALWRRPAARGSPADLQLRIRDRLALLLTRVVGAPARGPGSAPATVPEGRGDGAVPVDKRPDAQSIAVAGCRSHRPVALAIMPGSCVALVLRGGRRASARPRAVLAAMSLLEPVEVTPATKTVSDTLIHLSEHIELVDSLGRRQAFLTHTHRRVLRLLARWPTGSRRRAVDRIAICRRARELVELSTVAGATIALDAWLSDVSSGNPSTEQVVQLGELLAQRLRPTATGCPGLLLLGDCPPAP